MEGLQEHLAKAQAMKEARDQLMTEAKLDEESLTVNGAVYAKEFIIKP